jgi:hypothetical protein
MLRCCDPARITAAHVQTQVGDPAHPPRVLPVGLRRIANLLGRPVLVGGRRVGSGRGMFAGRESLAGRQSGRAAGKGGDGAAATVLIAAATSSQRRRDVGHPGHGALIDTATLQHGNGRAGQDKDVARAEARGHHECSG